MTVRRGDDARRTLRLVRLFFAEDPRSDPESQFSQMPAAEEEEDEDEIQDDEPADRMLGLREQVRELGNALRDVKAERDALRPLESDVERLRAEVERLESERERRDEELRGQQEEIEELATTVEQLELGQPDLRAEIEEVRARIEEIEGGKMAWELEKEELERGMEAVRRELEEERDGRREAGMKWASERKKLLNTIKLEGNSGAKQIRALKEEAESKEKIILLFVVSLPRQQDLTNAGTQAASEQRPARSRHERQNRRGARDSACRPRRRAEEGRRCSPREETRSTGRHACTRDAQKGGERQPVLAFQGQSCPARIASQTDLSPRAVAKKEGRSRSPHSPRHHAHRRPLRRVFLTTSALQILRTRPAVRLRLSYPLQNQQCRRTSFLHCLQTDARGDHHQRRRRRRWNGRATESDEEERADADVDGRSGRQLGETERGVDEAEERCASARLGRRTGGRDRRQIEDQGGEEEEVKEPLSIDTPRVVPIASH